MKRGEILHCRSFETKSIDVRIGYLYFVFMEDYYGNLTTRASENLKNHRLSEHYKLKSKLVKRFNASLTENKTPKKKTSFKIH